MNSKYFSPEVVNFVESWEQELETIRKIRDRIAEENEAKILFSMKKEKLASTDFHWTTGYGYGDPGREKVEKIFAHVFSGEEALVRPNLVSGTHAIHTVLKALLNPNDTLLSVGGPLYDTMQKALGLKGSSRGLLQKGIHYREVPLDQGKMDINEIVKHLTPNVKVAMIQRSTGYSLRPAFSPEEMKEVIHGIKEKSPDTIVFIDNCYGEFVKEYEPLEIGGDIIAGSLIKNPGGGLAFTGGYIVGKKEYVDLCAQELTAPGIGKECGLTFGMTRQVLQGLFLSPYTVKNALNTASLFALAFSRLGFETFPGWDEERSDIVQTIIFHDPNLLELFCQGIQEYSPVDAHFVPQPWDMPGYDVPVIMAAGGFVEGSSIELSADGPMREPYAAYFQGGFTEGHGKIALMGILEKFIQHKKISLKKGEH